MNLPQPVAVGIWVVLGVALLVLVLTGRRRLAGRSAGIVPVPPSVPAADARGPVVLGPLDALYVSSTLAGDWLARVGAHGLGDRSRAVVTVHEAGLHAARTGAPDLWVPAPAVLGGALTPGMAGKFVGKDAIVVVTWAVAGDAVPGDPVPGDPGTADGTGPSAARATPEPVRLDTGLMPRHDHDVPRLLEAVRDLAERRTTAPDGATDAPADPGGRPSSHDPGPDAAPNDKEAQ
ncbi:hypothetical protein [Cellulosimicrobium sp. CUA-896]|uniref:PH-like domain-containing protein n=1 Tax=Cellulosimicrobium sp. CUA-896 TaxID=1517881 RepID=UPI000963ED7E|nr:hypothetical protein [Cellulosimicrobium sp. CUA-896]OLT53021.1 hypothetical protein BJF88_00980 [Cellulosimicrobium sp. CUA-896]